MPGGAIRILPFALASTALHAVVLLSAPERLDIAVSPSGRSSAVSVRLVPAGPAAAEPATRSAVAEAVPRQDALRRAPDRGAASGDSEAEAAASTGESVAASTADTAATQTTAGTSASARTVADAAPEPAPPGRESTAETADTPADEPETAADTGDAPSDPESPSPSPAKSGAATEATADAQEHAEVPRATATSGAEGRHVRARLASRARQQVTVRFRERFRYPRIARQRGWEGRVVLGFRVHADGRISDVEVIESSGRSVLDENARRTLSRIERIPALGKRLRAGPLELEVPVTYRLQPA